MDRAVEALDPTLARALDEALDVEGMIAACQELVRIPSLSGEEAAAADALAACLRALGYDRVEIDEKGNVLGWIEGQGDGPTLLCNGHLDHVPPGEMTDPYGAGLVDAAQWGERGLVIAGRGTCDMKANVVAAAFGLAAIERAGVALRGTVVLNADVGEEIDSPDGVHYVLDRGLSADYGLSLEATGLGVYLGHRGKVEFELAVHGRMAHSSEPARGENAIERAVPLLVALQRHAATLLAHPLLGQGTLAAIDIRAEPGGNVAVIPDRCTIRVDRRYIPGETPESCQAELEGIVDELRAEDPDFRCDVTLVNHYPLFFIAPEHELIAAAQAVRAEMLGDEGELGAWRFGVNGTFMAQAGIPTIGFGPGDERWAHSTEEHVLVDDLVAAARFYARLAARVCGITPWAEGSAERGERRGGA